MKRILLALTWWMAGWAVLVACAASPEPHRLYSARPEVGVSEPIAGRPRLPVGKGTSTASKPPRTPEGPAAVPKPETKSPTQTPAPAQAQPALKPTPVQAAMTRWLDPKVARQRFDQGLAEAGQKFPHLRGKPPQEHHVHPKYLGGPQDGPTVKVDPAYHQFITNTFRREHAYDQDAPMPDVQLRIMKKVYSKYPLPGVHF